MDENTKKIYLDNAATTQMSEEVLSEILPYLKENYGNAGSLHGLGKQAKEALALARERVSDIFNCDISDIIFTSGGTESNALAIRGLEKYLLSAKQPTKVLSYKNEHKSVLKALEYLESVGIKVTYLNPGECIEDYYDEYAKLVVMMYVNNETGEVNDVYNVGKFCRENDIIFMTDCVQAAGNLDLDTQEIMCDMASISGHKIHGPKGVGALYVRNKTDILSPIIAGGESQEFGLRGGTENIPGIVGLGKAAEIAKKNLEKNKVYMSALKQIFVTGLRRGLAAYGIEDRLHINRKQDGIYCDKILNIRFDRIDSETCLSILDKQGVMASAGSACNSGEHHPSHVLIADGLTTEEASNSIRISFSELNSVNEAMKGAKRIADVVYLLSKIDIDKGVKN